MQLVATRQEVLQKSFFRSLAKVSTPTCIIHVDELEAGEAKHHYRLSGFFSQSVQPGLHSERGIKRDVGKTWAECRMEREGSEGACRLPVVQKCLMVAFQQTKHQRPQIWDHGEDNSALHFSPTDYLLSSNCRHLTSQLTTQLPEVKPLIPLLDTQSCRHVKPSSGQALRSLAQIRNSTVWSWLTSKENSFSTHDVTTDLQQLITVTEELSFPPPAIPSTAVQEVEKQAILVWNQPQRMLSTYSVSRRGHSGPCVAQSDWRN
ncbi:hypothetical protein PAMP_013841 [Pampus punctatissimus]